MLPERHFTVTTYIIQEKRVLLIFHPKFHKWLPPGGHLEKNETPIETAKREAKEETGLDIEIIPQENLWFSRWNAVSFERPYLCLLENIPPHGHFPAHQHIDLIYLARPIGGTEDSTLVEKGLLKWMDLKEVEALKSDEEIFGDTKEIIHHLLQP